MEHCPLVRIRRRDARTSIWRQPAGEFIVWLLPVALALMGHFYAWPKAAISDTGPAWRTEKTVRAQEAWRFLSSSWWLFITYGVVLATTCVLLKVKAVWWPVRLGIFAVLAIPGFWYFGLATYLGGKLRGL